MVQNCLPKFPSKSENRCPNNCFVVIVNSFVSPAAFKLVFIIRLTALQHSSYHVKLTSKAPVPAAAISALILPLPLGKSPQTNVCFPLNCRDTLSV